MIDSGQLLRQLPSCIHGASPYLYPATDNARSTYGNHVLTYNTLHSTLLSTDRVSALACKTEISRENHTARHFSNAHHCKDSHVLTNLLLDRSTNSTDLNTSFLLAKALRKSFPCPPSPRRQSRRAKAKRNKYARGHILCLVYSPLARYFRDFVTSLRTTLYPTQYRLCLRTCV